MTVGRKKCVIKGVKKQVMPHNDFIERIRKSLYFGGGTLCEEMEISSPLAEYASELFSEPHKNHSLNRLNKVAAGNCHAASPCSLIMALIYLDRLNATDSNYVRRITPTELFLVSMMVSTKFYSGHDEDFYLSDWTTEGNMTESQLKKLELEFLCAIDWNIYISNEQFFKKLETVEKILAHREGIKRGWLTYTELLNFLPSFTIVKFLLNNITIMAVSYAASVITIAGAFFLVSNIPGNGLLKENRDKLIKNNISINNATTNLLNINDNDNNKNNNSLIINKNSSSCPVINIEEELQKLENEYNEENNRILLLNKNNENSGPLINLNQNTILPINWRFDIHSGWNRFNNGNGNNNNDDNFYDNNFKNIQNYTKILFWNIFNDVAQNSFGRIPFIWFKFI